MEFSISSEIIEWRGPAPFFFIPINEEDSALIKGVSKEYSFGWGVLYVTVTVGETTWVTAVFPKDGRYLIPIKAEVRKATGLSLGDHVELHVKLGKNA